MTLQEDEDEFLYWKKISEDETVRSAIKRAQGAINTFVGLLQAVEIPYVEAHIFPFDTKSISVTFGGYDSDNASRYFSITLEDTEITHEAITANVRLTTWLGTESSRNFEKGQYGETNEGYGELIYTSKEIKIRELHSFLVNDVYEGKLREQYSYLPFLRI